MAKDDPLENRSEYQPPTSPPRARVPSKREYQSVKLDPTIDRRRAKTQISQRSMARASRSYTMTAFIAGALGALTASGVYLAMDDSAESEVAEPEAGETEAGHVTVPTRQGTLTPETPIVTRTATVEGESGVPGVGVYPVPFVAGSSPTVSPLASAEAGRDTRGSAPSANVPKSSGGAPNAAPNTPPGAPRLAPPATSASSKAWVDTPPRKVWVQ